MTYGAKRAVVRCEIAMTDSEHLRQAADTGCAGRQGSHDTTNDTQRQDATFQHMEEDQH